MLGQPRHDRLQLHAHAPPGARGRQPRERGGVDHRDDPALRAGGASCSRPTAATLNQPTYTVTLPDGTQVTAVIPPLPNPVPLVGYHQRVGQRAARPHRGAVPQRADRLLAALRREQLHGRRRPRRPRAHRHPGRGPGMSVTVQLGVGGTPVPDAFYDAIAQLEVEESSDQPGALLLQLPVNRTSAGDLQFVGDGTFEPHDEHHAHGHPGRGRAPGPSASSTGTSCPGGCTSTARRPRRRSRSGPRTPRGS